MHETPLPPCDAVAAIGEVLAYRPPPPAPGPDLGTIFGRIAAAMTCGGRLIFDLIVSGGEPVANLRNWAAGPDWAVMSVADEDAAAGVLRRHIVAFRQDGPGYRRSEETHWLAVLDPAAVLAMLDAAGFDAEAVPGYGGFMLPPRRRGFLARRR